MTIETLRFDDQPDRITQEKFDCIWLALAPRDAPSPLGSAALQWIDWKLCGQLSRFLLAERKAESVTFIPTMRRIPSPYLAIEPSSGLSWDVFARSCQGLQIRRLLYFCEEGTKIPAMEKAFHGHLTAAFPELVTLGWGA